MSEVSEHTPDEKLLRMAGQIADFFRSQPDQPPEVGVAGHINDFWGYRMRRGFLALRPVHVPKAAAFRLELLSLPDGKNRLAFRLAINIDRTGQNGCAAESQGQLGRTGLGCPSGPTHSGLLIVQGGEPLTKIVVCPIAHFTNLTAFIIPTVDSTLPKRSTQKGLVPVTRTTPSGMVCELTVTSCPAVTLKIAGSSPLRRNLK